MNISKKISSKIMTLILVWSLGISSITYAQSVSDVGSTATSTSAPVGQTSFKSNVDKSVGDDDFVTNLTALAASFVTVGMIAYCKPGQIDVYIAAGGGAIWMAGELMAAVNYKSISKDLEGNAIDEYSVKQEDTTKQLEAFYKLKASYEKAKSTIETKNKMQKVGLLAYTAAAATAFYLGVNPFGAVTSNTICAPQVTEVTPKFFSGLTNPMLAFALPLLIKNTKASTSPFWFLTGSAIGLFIALKKSVEVIGFIGPLTAVKRGVTWSAVALLLTQAISASENVVKKIEGNITKIDIIIKRLEMLQKGGFAQLSTTTAYSTYNPKNLKSTSFSVSSDKNLTTVCATSGSSSGSCPSLLESAKSSNLITSLPDGFQSIGTNLITAADSVSGKNTLGAGALGNINSLSGQSGALIKNLNDKSKELLAKSEEGKASKTDFDKSSKDRMNELKAATLKSLKNSGVTPALANSMVSGFGGVTGSSQAVASTGKEANTLTAKSIESKGLVNSASNNSANKGLDFKFDAKNANEISDLAESKNNASSDSLENYKNNFSDISADSNKNIFEIISGRYLKSGYPKLLEEEL